MVAKRLDYVYIDTGAMYRSVALFASREDICWDDVEGVSAVTASLEFTFRWEDERLRIGVNGVDVTDAIRQESIGQGASVISAHPSVRRVLLQVQRDLCAATNIVMEGRDIGTVVLPDAELKVFLDADVSVRARRRTDELAAKGLTVTYEGVLKDLQQRDWQDRNREAAPLRQADDAYYLDCTALTAVEVATRIIELTKEIV